MVHLRQNQSGVSLVEALVAMTVFGLALSLLAGIMSNSLRQQRKVNSDQLLAGNARDVMETIAREVRLDSIDYERHLIQAVPDDLDAPLNHLYLKNGTGQQLAFTGNGADVALNGAQISPNNIDIKQISFFIRPTSDPFFIQSCTSLTQDVDCSLDLYPVRSATCQLSGICDLVNEQPRVTIVINAQIRGTTDPSKQSIINLQTTVATRRYKR